jgi:hypothetical protein
MQAVLKSVILREQAVNRNYDISNLRMPLPRHIGAAGGRSGMGCRKPRFGERLSAPSGWFDCLK